jgi:hypothetical protein
MSEEATSRFSVAREHIRRATPLMLGAAVITLLGFGLVVGALIGAIAIKERSEPGDIKFDHDAWVANYGDRRWRMRHDLIHNYLKLGTPRSEAEALLGPGENRAAGNTYILRHDLSNFDPSVSELQLTYDPSDRLASVVLTRPRSAD